ncbi:uncharacterized protein EDB91DRAFT_1314852 [Suillus paluster]|uniref:uncharacterized protein n=1 Tax=Suillus paluster TaxID=48578 RepID=UPI001B86F0F9|nr:uncharacterized protein EDB91DRAFT_1314852 [Suillus paluster]KAG1748335.1 hypothetical protein EDB91DRAFT_1314852 [Suillus paluster]
MMRYGSDPRPPPYHSRCVRLGDRLMLDDDGKPCLPVNTKLSTFALATTPWIQTFETAFASNGTLSFATTNNKFSSTLPPKSAGVLEDDDRNRLREQWRRERANHESCKWRRGRRREEEERLRLNMFWTDAEPHMCTTYGTREYTARLVNVPSYYNRRVEACMATAIQIHGVNYTPKWCEDHGSNNVVGHWEVDQQQPDCVPHWDWYKDFGCVSPGSGQRRIEQHLKNIPEGADWREFCATTPASFNGVHFIGAQSCLLDPNNGGTWGYWDIDDERCNK